MNNLENNPNKEDFKDPLKEFLKGLFINTVMLLPSLMIPFIIPVVVAVDIYVWSNNKKTRKHFVSGMWASYLLVFLIAGACMITIMNGPH